MAERNFNPLAALGREYKVIAGSFLPNGSSAISASYTGVGFSVARTDVGLYTVTLQDAYQGMVAAVLQKALATPTGVGRLELGAVDVVTAKTIVIAHFADDGTSGVPAAADIAANAANRVHFLFILANSSVNG